MRTHRAHLFAALLTLTPAVALHAQAAVPLPANWRAEAPRLAPAERRGEAVHLPVYRFAAGDSVRTRTHPVTGLAIGAGVGLAAAGVLLSGFCSGGDDLCSSSDKVQLLFVAVVPPAAVGALIGSLIRTHR